MKKRKINKPKYIVITLTLLSAVYMLFNSDITAQSRKTQVRDIDLLEAGDSLLENRKSSGEIGENSRETGDQENTSPPRRSNVHPDYSNIEEMFNKTFNVNLKQYGYDYFSNFIKDKFLPVGDKYVVGPGDTVAIYFWGDPVEILGLNGFYSITVDRDGKIFIPQLGAFYVWGLDISGVKNLVNKAMRRKFRRFELEITLGKLREFPVYVSGFVNQPGITLTLGVSNVMDVLSLSDGVSKNGTLRNITLRRMEEGKEKIIRIDLYDLLIKGSPPETKIQEGDSIFVNPIGKTVGISGVVQRPAIYELGEGTATIEDAIDLAGGILPSVYTPGITLHRYQKDSLSIKEGDLNNKDFLETKLMDGDFIRIKPLFNLVENAIQVRGHVAYPGNYSWSSGLKLSAIIKKLGVLPDTNMFSANIIRRKEKKVIPFVPEDVINGEADHDLDKQDIITFYPRWIYKPVTVTGEVGNSKIIPFYEKMTLLDVLQQIDFKQPVQNLKAEIFFDDENNDVISGAEHITVYLQDLLVRASKEDNFPIKPGSKIIINTIESSEKGKTVTLLGKVARPGVYNFKEGMTLYDLIKSVGGYTPDSYPQGLIFIRRSAMKLQEKQIKVSLLSMKESLARQQEAYSMAGPEAEDRALIKMIINQYEQMLNIIKQKSEMALGRIALEIPADLDELKDHPDNIRLAEGDYIFVPQRPSYILVLGDVYNQMSLPYDSGKTVKYYLNQMGGLAKHADEDDIYIIKSNGKIISKQQFNNIFKLYFLFDWDRNKLFFARDFDSMVLEEGDTIVVPTEFKIPVMWRSLLKDIAQIMFQSISTAVLATRL